MAIIDNIISYWKLDDTSGSMVDELSTNDGVVNGVTRGGAGLLSDSYSFDGNDFVTVADDTSLNGLNALTISLWINTTTTAEQDFFSKVKYYTAGEKGYGVGIKLNVVYFYLLNGVGATRVQGLTSINTGSWVHIVCTWDGTTGVVYVNGSSDNSGSISASDITNTRDLTFGRRTGAANYYVGLTDEVGLWSRALSPAEVATLYNSGSGLTYPFSVASSSISKLKSVPWADISKINGVAVAGISKIKGLTV